jgi:hypothetical protein
MSQQDDTMDELVKKTDEYNEAQMENERELCELVDIRMNAYVNVPKTLRTQYASRLYILVSFHVLHRRMT